MDRQRAGVRLQVVLRHLSGPSAPAIVSFGLRRGSGWKEHLYPGCGPKGTREPLRCRLFLFPLPGGSGEQAASPCSGIPLPPRSTLDRAAGVCDSAWPGWLVRVPAPFRDCLAPQFLALCKAKEVKQEVATSSQKELCHIQLPWHFSALCFPTFPRNAL